ncbi:MULTISPECIES: DUF3987 domain-containing protein [unclassified Microcoleus]|uniref:DUF3987 domain-containing protein n=1 Tax=unclassified Microcoleus TaxID=2642155 RepID=UPI002FD606F2
MSVSNDSSNNSSFPASTFVSQKHLTEWVEGSAVSEAIARLSIESLTATELNERIQPKDPIKDGGWWCRGVNWRTGAKMGNRYGQSKPDKPHHPEGSKPRKYLTASGVEADAIFLPMPDKDYWLKTHSDTSIPRHWTEGVKKAGAGLSIGLATIAVTGVWNWGKNGKLAEFVEQWAQPGTTHYINFDSDYAVKPECYAGILKFAYLLAERGCQVHITVWVTKFKGMDDFIKAHGANAFKEAVANAPTLADWEQQVKKSDCKNNLVAHPKFEPQPLATLPTEIDQLLTQDLKQSELKIQVLELSQKLKVTKKEIWNLYKTREEEPEQAEAQEDTATEVARLLASKSASLKISEILPETLAEPIERLAKILNLRPECYLMALLVQSGSLLKVGTSTMVCERSNKWESSPNYFGVIVAESPQKKSPIMRAIINQPMEKLLDRSKREYEAAQAAYEQELAEWNSKDGNPKPKPPAQKVYAFTDATLEGIANQAHRMPEQGLLWVCDELAGAFKSANQYRGGRGGDEEKILEYWNHGRSTTLRASGLTADTRVNLSIFGAIQPKVLAGFLGDGSDNNGKFARFDFIQQPLAATKLREASGFVDLTPMLTSLYEKLDSLPPTKFALDPTAGKLFEEFNDYCEEERISHPKQGMRAMWGKAPEKVGKLVTILHCIYAKHLSIELSKTISADTVRTAIKFVKFTIDQALSLNLEACGPNSLAPNLAKIVLLAERKGGTVSINDCRRSFESKNRPTTQQMREWFGELAAMQYGKVVAEGKSIFFTISSSTFSSSTTPPPLDPLLGSKADTEKVSVLHSSTPLPPLSPLWPTPIVEKVEESGGWLHSLKPLVGNDFRRKWRKWSNLRKRLLKMVQNQKNRQMSSLLMSKNHKKLPEPLR